MPDQLVRWAGALKSIREDKKELILTDFFESEQSQCPAILFIEECPGYFP
jgi:hypothetical protein